MQIDLGNCRHLHLTIFMQECHLLENSTLEMELYCLSTYRILVHTGRLSFVIILSNKVRSSSSVSAMCIFNVLSHIMRANWAFRAHAIYLMNCCYLLS